MQFSLLVLTSTLALTIASPVHHARGIPGVFGHHHNHPDDDDHGDQFIGNSGQNTNNIVTNTGNVGGNFNVEQVSQVCGNTQMNCCNMQSSEGDTNNIGGFLDLIGFFSPDAKGVQCSPLDVGVLGGSSVCSNNVACCQGNNINQNGVINTGGCFSLGRLI